MSPKQPEPTTLYRPVVLKLFSSPIFVVLFVFVVHALIRFGGLWNSMFIPLSMVIIWPLPWLLSPKVARIKMRFQSPGSWKWLLFGPLAAIAALFFCIALSWGMLGEDSSNWFTQHTLMLKDTLSQMPDGSSTATQFWMVTIPAMIFSPLGEEFLYRGFLLKTFKEKWGYKLAMIFQASAFALVHLAHYGLLPFQPLLILVWIPSMFVTAWILGWIVTQSESIWIGVLSHSVFNLGMNGVVFLMLPNFL